MGFGSRIDRSMCQVCRLSALTRVMPGARGPVWSLESSCGRLSECFVRVKWVSLKMLWVGDDAWVTYAL